MTRCLGAALPIYEPFLILFFSLALFHLRIELETVSLEAAFNRR